MRISIAGAGYLGLVTGICLSETGNDVCFIDDDEIKITNLKKGNLDIHEPGLEVLFKRNVDNGRLRFTINKQDFKSAAIIFLTQPVPIRRDGATDTKGMLELADQIGKYITHYSIIAISCSVPVGTAEKVRLAIARHYRGSFDVVSNPEFLCEGRGVDSFMRPDKVIVGTDSERAQKVMKDLYTPIVKPDNPVLFMDQRSAELTKFVADAFLATKISFMNEVANLCEELDADIHQVKKGIDGFEQSGKHTLSGNNALEEARWSKDMKMLMQTAEELNYEFRILKAVSEVIANQNVLFINKILNHFTTLNGKHFAIWGISTKSDTADVRETPAANIIKFLLEKGATISVYDPAVSANQIKIVSEKIQLADTLYDCLENADALIITTESIEFKTPDFNFMTTQMNEPVIFDKCNLFELSTMEEKGFYYYSIGRSLVNQLNLVL